MKKHFVWAASLALLALGGQAFAVLDTIEATPAATLLIPYFAVDTVDENGINTLFSVNNASAAPVLAHVTFWTDQSVPSLDFDIYLTGFDVQTLNVRDIFINRNLPMTGLNVSPVGDYSIPDPIVPFGGGCNMGPAPGAGPNYANPAITAGHQQQLIAWHTGQPTPFGGLCAGDDHGDAIARGYITIDVTNQCSTLFPSNLGYFGDLSTGIAEDDNVLWGDYFLVDTANNFAEGNTAVHIEASPDAYTAGDYTFYGRYLTVPWSGTDGREGLATTFASRYALGGGFDGGTQYTIWRDSTTNSPDAFSCAIGPSWYPLSLTQGIVFNEEEQVFENPECPSGAPDCTAEGFFIPNETQRVDVGSGAIPVPAGFSFGWVYLNLNEPSSVFPGGPFSQNWMTWSMSALGRFQVGLDSVQFDNVANPNTVFITQP